MNAIILAAGMGTRMRPLTEDKPKCLVSVCGEPIIERQIRFLREAGINDIVIVSGYKSEKLDYLVGKYPGVIIVPNPMYERYNNIYSMYLVQSYFGDSYVIEGDVYIEKNCFLDISPNYSMYISTYRTHYEREWELLLDEEYNLRGININSGSGYIMSGISYWIRRDSTMITDYLNRLVHRGCFEELFWDHIVMDLLPELSIKVVPSDGIHEIDTVRELGLLESYIQEKCD